MTKIQTLKKKMDTLREEITTEAKAMFKEQAAEIFKKYPAMENFGWGQWTIYFNDGDELYFTVNEDFATINGEDSYSDEAFKPEKAYKDVSSLLNEIGEEYLKAMFGDHCKVLATKDDITVTSYTAHD